ncbi:hypothetical protein ACVWXL_005806 [Bradyrhizobium sp. GM22.5]
MLVLFERPIVQRGLSPHGAGATCRDRPRGRCAAGADAPGFGTCDCGRCRFAQRRDSEAILLALAADHLARDTLAFVAACRGGLAAVSVGRIVTFGLKPERPATEYGYINPGEVVAGEVRGGKVRREAGCRNRSPLYRCGLSLERRQLHVPRQCAAGRVSLCRCGQRCLGGAVGCHRDARSRLRQARCAGVWRGEGDLDRLRGYGEDIHCCGGAVG